ncbi:glycogen/starch synthase [Flavobacteriaceae bacterium]|jgi:starch synthase|nr:glycogen/starch synthase [Flavobacteriaceae bacterium]MDB4050322.1 glycogen/starch synthase [Flavobacteriaceae bacterium]MDB4086382.1 glycogen/starch synthase [Flavobacteriaceae bacterium]MDB4239876.1 glycogen/starch synthase [Flavobacteriaceae bacterium]MDB9901629.1 glycogen/starch synthase [Flavobacteriaceae bacterium]
MTGKKVLYVSSEVIPYLPNNDISTLTYNLPKVVNKNGGQTRIFIPKYGLINERRHQLHEVIRLSGMNLIIDDLDMPLIIKVASIPKERMQVYFIDNDEYFKNRLLDSDKNKNLYKDNDERAIFFAKGVVETIKKLNWVPDIIHVHGWIASLMPLYLKQYYKDEPLLSKSKVVTSIYDNEISGDLNPEIIKKIKFDEVESETLNVLENPTYENLYKLSIMNSDGVVFASENINKSYLDIATKCKLPILKCGFKEGFEIEYLDFYNEKILN